jgi:hypothetical protein
LVEQLGRALVEVLNADQLYLFIAADQVGQLADLDRDRERLYGKGLERSIDQTHVLARQVAFNAPDMRVSERIERSAAQPASVLH